MKFVRFDGGITGVVVGDAETDVMDLAASVPALRRHDPAGADLLASLLPGNGSGTWRSLIESWDKARPVIESMISGCKKNPEGFRILPLNGLRLLPPVSDPSRSLFAIGANHVQHMIKGLKGLKGIDITAEEIIREKHEGKPPWGFHVHPAVLAAQGDDVAPPSHAQLFDYEAEVAVALRATGRDLKYDRSCIWGYTAMNDLSLRDPHVGIGPDTERGNHSWATDKNFAKSKPCGPWMVVDDSIDVDNLRAMTRVNGQVRQDFSTADMIWSFGTTIEFLSHFIPLTAGDMIMSGTGDGCAADGGINGSNWLKPGDEIEVEIEGVGILRNRVVDWKA